MNETFLPQGYEAPKTGGNYLKFNQGDNVFRILGNPILGWLDWTNDNKPVRTPYNQQKPTPIKSDKPVRHFWALPVWDYRDKAVKILEITQSGIQNAIQDFFKDEAWGSPLKYDLNVKRTGEGKETEYAVIARPPQPLSQEVRDAYSSTPIDLMKLFENGDPFDVKPTPAQIMQQAMNEQKQIEENVEKMPIF